MSWLYLIVAAIFEIDWPLGFKLSTMHPTHRVGWILFSATCSSERTTENGESAEGEADEKRP